MSFRNALLLVLQLELFALLSKLFEHDSLFRGKQFLRFTLRLGKLLQLGRDADFELHPIMLIQLHRERFEQQFTPMCRQLLFEREL